MLAITYSVALIGVEAEVITIEVNSGVRGKHRYIRIGLPDSVVKKKVPNKPNALPTSHSLNNNAMHT
jgi:hypothetical protein